ncbi:hypothetical protein HHK36_003261 [Tetracentron sinense]|uniref:Aconitase A/isopropylmalate dehydratase small subunit swivel domain-containing protein n=1 Tax=Tetracentron sinense TaxID=13715 RepID=A0A834ZNF1_TETSI|nr:hypothetical protein HHK36_003261 [Tetracentron sinense]
MPESLQGEEAFNTFVSSSDRQGRTRTRAQRLSSGQLSTQLVQKTKWNHATHGAGVLPANEERKKSDKVQFRFDCLQHTEETASSPATEATTSFQPEKEYASTLDLAPQPFSFAYASDWFRCWSGCRLPYRWYRWINGCSLCPRAVTTLTEAGFSVDHLRAILMQLTEDFEELLKQAEEKYSPLQRAIEEVGPELAEKEGKRAKLSTSVDIDFDKDPIGTGKDGKSVFFKDIWPSTEEIAEAVQSSVLPDMFKSTYKAITGGNPMWNQLSVPAATLYSWDANSTYIHEPPYFKNMTMDPPGPHGVKDAYCLLNFGDSITTDHISPAGSINKDSPAAKYLLEREVDRKDFNSYGSRRGNDEVMARGTFANIRIVNKLLNGEVGPKTIHIPTGEKLSVFDAAMKYKAAGQDTIVLAGAEYGSGSSRDWAAKGPMLLVSLGILPLKQCGVKAVISKSFERIHRSNLVGMGIIPLCFKAGEDAETLGLTGHERYTIDLPSKVSDIKPGQDVTVTTDSGKSFTCTARFDTEVELAYFDHGGILPYVIRNLIKSVLVLVIEYSDPF